MCKYHISFNCSVFGVPTYDCTDVYTLVLYLLLIKSQKVFYDEYEQLHNCTLIFHFYSNYGTFSKNFVTQQQYQLLLRHMFGIARILQCLTSVTSGIVMILGLSYIDQLIHIPYIRVYQYISILEHFQVGHLTCV